MKKGILAIFSLFTFVGTFSHADGRVYGDWFFDITNDGIKEEVHLIFAPNKITVFTICSKGHKTETVQASAAAIYTEDTIEVQDIVDNKEEKEGFLCPANFAPMKYRYKIESKGKNKDNKINFLDSGMTMDRAKENTVINLLTH